MGTIRITYGGDYDPNNSTGNDTGHYQSLLVNYYGHNEFDVYDGSNGSTSALINSNYHTDGIYADFSDQGSDASLTGGDKGDVLIGGYGDDTIDGGAGNDVIMPSYGENTVHGGLGFDVLSFAGLMSVSGDGGGFARTPGGGGVMFDGIESIIGTSGQDALLAENGDGVMTLEGGAGSDRLDFADPGGTVSYAHSPGAVQIILNGVSTIATASGNDADGDIVQGATNIIGSAYDDVLSGDDQNNHLYGFGGSDTLSGGGGDDRLQVSSTPTSIDGGDGHDELVIHGTNLVDPSAGAITGVEQIVIAAGASLSLANQTDAVGKIITHSDLTTFTNVTATEGADMMHGGAGYDRLDGGAGDDRINGGAGDDRITGGVGGDHMTGGAGADTFVFQSLSEFGVGKHVDRILDFSGSGLSSNSAHSAAIAPSGDGDKIDLTQIANFTFIGTAKFDANGTAELRIVAHDGGYLVKGDIDGDGVAEFKFQVNTKQPLTADDFVQSSSAAQPCAGIGGHLDLHPSFAPMHGMEHAAIA